MPATMHAVPAVEVELEELEQRPMSDHEHEATFGWAWDDPNAVEVGA